jgi:hypothetical protein
VSERATKDDAVATKDVCRPSLVWCSRPTFGGREFRLAIPERVRVTARGREGRARRDVVARTWRRVKLLIRASGVFLSANCSKSGCRLHRASTSPNRNPDAKDCRRRERMRT